MSEEKKYTVEEAHRFLAAKLNGDVWSLLEKPDRSRDEDELMIYTAYASCYHWLQVGIGVNQQRGEWLISRVYSELGMADSALVHAQRCLNLTEEHAELMQDFDRAYAYECMTRAHAIAGNIEDARRYLQHAEKAGQEIENEEDKIYFHNDLKSGDWNDVR